MKNMNIIFVIIGGIIFLIPLVARIISLFRHSEEKEIEAVDTACAGSAISQTPQQITTSSASLQQLHVDNDNLDEYKKFWIKGWSMLLCGIRNDDILFTELIASDKIKNLSFETPEVLVLQREGQSLHDAIAQGDYANYKVRRTWAMMNFNEKEIIAKVQEIITNNKDFQQLREDYKAFFYENKDIINDLSINRIAKYRREYPDCENISSKDNLVIISTTLRQIEGNYKVFFSIHPARIIVAKAIYTFHKEENDKNTLN